MLRLPKKPLVSEPLRSMALVLWALSFCAITPSARAQDKPKADLLVFTNGDQLTGTLIRSVGDTVTFKSEMAGEISVPLAKIKELRTAGQYAVLRKDVPATKVRAKTGTVEVTDGKLAVTRGGEALETVPSEQLAYVVDEPSYTKAYDNKGPFFSGWNGSINGGATLVRSTQNATTLTAGAALVKETPGVAFLPAHSRILFNLAEAYGKLSTPVIPPTVPASPASVVKTDIFHADAEYDRYFSPRLYALADTAFDHNFSQGLQLQQIYGGGLGYTVIKQPLQEFDVKGEVHYERQNFIGGVGDQNLIGALFGESYRRSLPLKMVFTESGTVDPAFNNTDAYSAHAQAALAIPAYKRLGFSIGAVDDYLNNPPLYFKKNSVQFTTGITYSLR